MAFIQTTVLTTCPSRRGAGNEDDLEQDDDEEIGKSSERLWTKGAATRKAAL